MTTTPSSTLLPTTLRRALFALGFASLGALGTIGLTAAAGHGPGGPGMSRGGHGARVMMMAISQLDLSAEQQAELEAARTDIVEHMQASRSELRSERGELLQALRDGTLSREDLHARIDERAAQATESMHYGIDRLMDVYETLDAEQQAELVELLEQVQERRSERRGRRGGDFSGPELQGE